MVILVSFLHFASIIFLKFTIYDENCYFAGWNTCAAIEAMMANPVFSLPIYWFCSRRSGKAKAFFKNAQETTYCYPRSASHSKCDILRPASSAQVSQHPVARRTGYP